MTLPIPAERHLLDLGPAVTEAAHRLRAGLHPADRATKVPRGPGDEELLGIPASLRTEAAADVQRDDVHRLRRHCEHTGELVADPVRALRRGPLGEPSVGPRRRPLRRAPRAGTVRPAG